MDVMKANEHTEVFAETKDLFLVPVANRYAEILLLLTVKHQTQNLYYFRPVGY